MNKVSKTITVVVSVLILIVVLFAWLKGRHKAIQQPPSTAARPIKIGIAIYPGYGTYYIAKDKGFFDAEGVPVEIVQLSLENMIPALESGEVDMLTATSDTMPVIANGGIPAKQIFSTSISHGADGLVVTNSIQDIKDLKGKKVYTGFGFPGHFFLRYLAAQAGLKPEDIELVDLGSDEVGASFVSGKIDAGMTWEPWLSKAQERKDGKVLTSSRQEPGIITDVTIARDDLIQSRKDDTKKVMRAFFKAVDWWNLHPSEGNAIVAKNFNLTEDEFAPMRDTVQLSDLATNLEKFDKHKPRNVYELAQKASEIFLADHIIKNPVNPDSVTDASLLNELKNEPR